VCNYNNWNGKVLSSQGKKRTKLALLVQILENFMAKKRFLAKKNCASLSALLKITQDRVEISLKFQRIWIQQAKSNL
jgi:hypothetical protein